MHQNVEPEVYKLSKLCQIVRFQPELKEAEMGINTSVQIGRRERQESKQSVHRRQRPIWKVMQLTWIFFAAGLARTQPASAVLKICGSG